MIEIAVSPAGGRSEKQDQSLDDEPKTTPETPAFYGGGEMNTAERHFKFQRDA
jgi:hypothetical protein